MPKRRSRIIRKVKAEEVAEEEPVEKRKSRRAKKPIKTEGSSDEMVESDTEVMPKVKPTRSRKGLKAESDDEEEALVAEIKANMKATRSRKQVKKEDVMEDAKPLKITPKAEGRMSKRTTNRNKSS